MKTRSLTGTENSLGPGSECVQALSCMAKKSQGYDMAVRIREARIVINQSDPLRRRAAEQATTKSMKTTLNQVYVTAGLS